MSFKECLESSDHTSKIVIKKKECHLKNVMSGTTLYINQKVLLKTKKILFYFYFFMSKRHCFGWYFIVSRYFLVSRYTNMPKYHIWGL